MAKRSTSTSAFGVSRRESHDATAFYRRFAPGGEPLVLLTAGRPERGTGAEALAEVVGPSGPIHTVVDLTAADALAVLGVLAAGRARAHSG